MNWDTDDWLLFFFCIFLVSVPTCSIYFDHKTREETTEYCLSRGFVDIASSHPRYYCVDERGALYRRVD